MPEPSKTAADPKPEKSAQELDEEQLDKVSGGMIIDGCRDGALGGPDTKMGPTPHMNPQLLTQKVSG